MTDTQYLIVARGWADFDWKGQGNLLTPLLAPANVNPDTGEMIPEPFTEE